MIDGHTPTNPRLPVFSSMPKKSTTAAPLLSFSRARHGGYTLSVKKAAHSALWTEEDIAAVFGVARSTVATHIATLSRDNGPLVRRTRRETPQVRAEGPREVTRQRAEYSLEMLIAVGLRLRGARADALRAWVARTIPHHLAEPSTPRKPESSRKTTRDPEREPARESSARTAETPLDMSLQKALTDYRTHVHAQLDERDDVTSKDYANAHAAPYVEALGMRPSEIKERAGNPGAKGHAAEFLDAAEKEALRATLLEFLATESTEKPYL